MSSDRLSPNIDFSAHGRCFVSFFQNRASSSERKNDGRGDRKSIAKSIEKTSKNRWEIDRKIERRHDRTDDRKKARKTSKIGAFRPRKSSLGTSGRAKTGSDKARGTPWETVGTPWEAFLGGTSVAGTPGDPSKRVTTRASESP